MDTGACLYCPSLRHKAAALVNCDNVSPCEKMCFALFQGILLPAMLLGKRTLWITAALSPRRSPWCCQLLNWFGSKAGLFCLFLICCVSPICASQKPREWGVGNQCVANGINVKASVEHEIQSYIWLRKVVHLIFVGIWGGGAGWRWQPVFTFDSAENKFVIPRSLVSACDHDRMENLC